MLVKSLLVFFSHPSVSLNGLPSNIHIAANHGKTTFRPLLCQRRLVHLKAVPWLYTKFLPLVGLVLTNAGLGCRRKWRLPLRLQPSRLHRTCTCCWIRPALHTPLLAPTLDPWARRTCSPLLLGQAGRAVEVPSALHSPALPQPKVVLLLTCSGSFIRFHMHLNSREQPFSFQI